MSVIIVLVIVGVVVAGGFLAAFIWAVKSGQYEDTDSPAMRMLFDDTHPVDKPGGNVKAKHNAVHSKTKS
ncbi:MAG TPA: cbb3-type cytochrome oxidase assembly protein CcoS [Bacteroidetes bacterium]|nr:cbb3-type cytochrome oxidase assembly protein CcoS [Bacteroidota bacterium]